MINLGLGGPAISTAERPVVRDHDVLSSELVERHGDGARTRGVVPTPGCLPAGSSTPRLGRRAWNARRGQR